MPTVPIYMNDNIYKSFLSLSSDEVTKLKEEFKRSISSAAKPMKKRNG